MHHVWIRPYSQIDRYIFIQVDGKDIDLSKSSFADVEILNINSFSAGIGVCVCVCWDFFLIKLCVNWLSLLRGNMNLLEDRMNGLFACAGIGVCACDPGGSFVHFFPLFISLASICRTYSVRDWGICVLKRNIIHMFHIRTRMYELCDQQRKILSVCMPGFYVYIFVCVFDSTCCLSQSSQALFYVQFEDICM